MGRLCCCDCLEVLEKQRKQAVAVLLAFAQTIEERDYRHDDLRRNRPTPSCAPKSSRDTSVS